MRKKLHKGEFTQYGFTVEYQVRAGLDADASDALLDRFILEAVEANDLHCGGGGGPAAWDFFVCANGRRSASEADRQAIEQWLQRQKEVTLGRVGALEDAWFGQEKPASGTQHGSNAAQPL